MGLDKFIYLLLIIATMVMFYEKDKKIATIENEEKPEISFYDSTAYEITLDGVNHVVKSSEAYLFKNREELIDGTLIGRAKEARQLNIITGNYFIKVGNDLYVDGDVKLQLANSIDVDTEQLEYNIQTKIVKNSSPFVATQYNHTFRGKNIYLDTQKRYISALNTKMKIEVTNE